MADYKSLKGASTDPHTEAEQGIAGVLGISGVGGLRTRGYIQRPHVAHPGFTHPIYGARPGYTHTQRRKTLDISRCVSVRSTYHTEQCVLHDIVYILLRHNATDLGAHRTKYWIPVDFRERVAILYRVRRAHGVFIWRN